MVSMKGASAQLPKKEKIVKKIKKMVAVKGASAQIPKNKKIKEKIKTYKNECKRTNKYRN